jgi:hypothetical protein
LKRTVDKEFGIASVENPEWGIIGPGINKYTQEQSPGWDGTAFYPVGAARILG